MRDNQYRPHPIPEGAMPAYGGRGRASAEELTADGKATLDYNRPFEWTSPQPGYLLQTATFTELASISVRGYSQLMIDVQTNYLNAAISSSYNDVWDFRILSNNNGIVFTLYEVIGLPSIGQIHFPISEPCNILRFEGALSGGGGTVNGTYLLISIFGLR